LIESTSGGSPARKIGEAKSMTCREFQRKWDELLDAEARGRAVADDEARLAKHATACPACRPIAARYQTLRHAIRAWHRPPVPPADLVQRILSAPADQTSGAWRTAARGWWRKRRLEVAVVTGLAASMMLLTLITEYLRRDRRGRPDVAVRVADGDRTVIAGSDASQAGPRDLNRALAEATTATLDLARSASEPAARISRGVLGTATRAESSAGDSSPVPTSTPPAAASEGLASLSVPMPSLDPLAPDGSSASAVLQQVGDQVSAGVRPLSTTARHAFGFLLGSPGPRAGSGARAPTL
jgi:hypothetical protein